MAEPNNMSEENKKTIIAFIAGLLIGGLLVFIFSEPGSNNGVIEPRPDEDQDMGAAVEADAENEALEISKTTGDGEVTTERSIVRGGSVAVADQSAGSLVVFADANFPSDAGWVGVRDYADGQLTGLLGVVRWSKSERLLPQQVSLLRPTEPGKTYAVVFYTDNGDKAFNLATDAQIDGVMELFRAQ